MCFCDVIWYLLWCDTFFCISDEKWLPGDIVKRFIFLKCVGFSPKNERILEWKSDSSNKTYISPACCKRYVIYDVVMWFMMYLWCCDVIYDVFMMLWCDLWCIYDVCDIILWCDRVKPRSYGKSTKIHLRSRHCVSSVCQRHLDHITKYIIWITKYIIWITKHIIWITKHIIWITKLIIWITNHIFMMCFFRMKPDGILMIRWDMRCSPDVFKDLKNTRISYITS